MSADEFGLSLIIVASFCIIGLAWVAHSVRHLPTRGEYAVNNGRGQWGWAHTFKPDAMPTWLNTYPGSHFPEFEDALAAALISGRTNVEWQGWVYTVRDRKIYPTITRKELNHQWRLASRSCVEILFRYDDGEVMGATGQKAAEIHAYLHNASAQAQKRAGETYMGECLEQITPPDTDDNDVPTLNADGHPVYPDRPERGEPCTYTGTTSSQPRSTSPSSPTPLVTTAGT